MAIGTITSVDAVGQDDLQYAEVSFAGDDSYPTGGTLAFQTALRALLDRNVEILHVLNGDNGDYVAIYLPGTDALKVVLRSTGAEVGAATDLSGTTFTLGILYK